MPGNQIVPGDDIFKKSDKVLDGLAGGLYFFIESLLDKDINSPSFEDAVLPVFEKLLQFFEINPLSFVESNTENIHLFAGFLVLFVLHLG